MNECDRLKAAFFKLGGAQDSTPVQIRTMIAAQLSSVDKLMLFRATGVPVSIINADLAAIETVCNFNAVPSFRDIIRFGIFLLMLQTPSTSSHLNRRFLKLIEVVYALGLKPKSIMWRRLRLAHQLFFPYLDLSEQFEIPFNVTITPTLRLEICQYIQSTRPNEKSVGFGVLTNIIRTKDLVLLDWALEFSKSDLALIHLAAAAATLDDTIYDRLVGLVAVRPAYSVADWHFNSYCSELPYKVFSQPKYDEYKAILSFLRTKGSFITHLPIIFNSNVANTDKMLNLYLETGHQLTAEALQLVMLIRSPLHRAIIQHHGPHDPAIFKLEHLAIMEQW